MWSSSLGNLSFFFLLPLLFVCCRGWQHQPSTTSLWSSQRRRRAGGWCPSDETVGVSGVSGCFFRRSKVSRKAELGYSVAERLCQHEKELLVSTSSVKRRSHHMHQSVSRRDWILQIGLIFAASAATSTVLPSPAAAETTAPSPPATTPAKSTTLHSSSKPSAANKTCSTSIELSNLKGIASEVNINVTSVTKTTEGILPKTMCESIDRSTYTKVKKVDTPWFIPEALRPKVIKTIPNSQLLLAGIVAGSATEIARISLLFPLDTVKNRIQADPRHRKARTWRRKMQLLYLSFLRKWREGDLYAGILPSILVSVPASGVYCGIRDVTKRVLAGGVGGGGHGLLAALPQGAGPVIVSLAGAIVADVASLAVRTPADVLVLRLQVGTADGEDYQSDLWEALGDGWSRLPTVIVTDLPYLLSRIALNYAVLTGAEGLGRYQAETVAIACGCAFLTTPFDVARTRILVDHGAPLTGAEGQNDGRTTKRRSRRRDGVIYTMAKVAREGNSTGIQNLFAGAIERTAYNGIVRAWLDPIRLIGYMGIRDAVLLKWFD